MKYRKLGRTGFEVSDIAHGLWGMSGWSGSEDRESLAAMQLAVDLGCNFFDTAWAYGEGKSDGLLGKICRNNAGKKTVHGVENSSGNLKWPALPTYKYEDVFSAQHVFKYADLIRKQLQVDTIDLLQFHVWADAWVRTAGVPQDGGEVKTDEWIRFVWSEYQSVGARKWDQGHADRISRCCAGDLQHFRSGAGRRAISGVSGTKCWRDCARASR